MLALLSPIDYGVLALFLAAVVAAAVYFSSRQKDTAEFFLASRGLGWFPLSLSLAATFVSLITFNWLPAEAYESGWKCAVVVLAIWLVLPVAVFLVIPLYRGLKLVSLYEYLEHRFDSRVRLSASLVFVLWRIVWMAGAVYFPCEAIRIASGWNVPLWPFVIAMGALATLIAFLGGMRVVAWTGVFKALVMVGATAVVIFVVWMNMDDGPARVAEIARGLGRTQPADLSFSWNETWTLWGALPFWVLTLLTFCIADQVTAQRFLSAKSENAARSAYLYAALTLTLLLPGLVYAGLGLLAFYYDHPQEMRPEWVVNVDNKTREPIQGEDGQPLLDERNPAHAVTFENIDRLVEQRRILQPNSKEPFTSAAGLVDPDTNRVLIEKLAMRRPNNDRLRGEIIVSRNAPRQMLPQFAAQHLSYGAAGLLLAALVGAALGAIDSGLSALCTVIVRDLVGRFGWGKAWLASRLKKEPSQLDVVDELQLARPLTIGLGAFVIVAALAAAMFTDGFSLLIGAAGALGAPLLAVLLLGILTRQATAAAAIVALALGTLFTLGLSAAIRLSAAGVLQPDYAMAGLWSVTFGFAFTLVLGYALSFVLGRRKSTIELRGLVAGCGSLGVRAAQEEVPLITVPDPQNEIRWK